MRSRALVLPSLFAASLLGCRGEAPACVPAATAAPASPATAPPAQPAPLVPASAVGVTLPTTSEIQRDALFMVTITRDGTVLLDGARIEAAALPARARASLQARPDLLVLVAADRTIPFEQVVRVVDLVKQGGATRVTFAVSAASAAAGSAAAGPAAAATGVAAAPSPDGVPTPSVYAEEPWRCPHPGHAGQEKHDDVWVFVRIHVDASGNPEKVDVLEDPGRGFGEAARACAMQRSYRPAVDASGRAVKGALKLRIRFAP